MQPLKILPGRVFDDEKLDDLRRLYLEKCMPARECAKRLGLTPKQVRSKVHKLGWSQVRTQVGASTIKRCEEALAKKVTNTGTELAPLSNAGTDEYIDKVTDKARKVADKGFAMAEDAKNPRDLNSAIQAASKAVTLYRQSKGLDAPGNLQPGGFNMFFMNTQISPIQPAI